MAGKDNLRVPTSAEARENGRKGGIASGKARRDKKAMRETLEALLNMPMKVGDVEGLEDIESISKLSGANITAQEAMLFKLVSKAAKKGGYKDIELIWKMLKEDKEPVENNDNDAVLAFIEAMRK